MTLYIDSDALPKIAKELIIKSATRTQTPTIFVANAYIALPPSPYLSSVVVAQGFDVADDYIAEHAGAGDIVISSDIPLIGAALDKGAWALSAWGVVHTLDTIGARRGMRDLMDTLRGTGVLSPEQQGSQKPYSDKDKKHFADALNRLLDKHKKHPNNIAANTIPKAD